MNKGQRIISYTLIKWSRNFQHRHFILFLSLIIGLFSGFSAILLKNVVHFIEHTLSIPPTS